ncbi:MAG: hypothetical protein AB7N73_12165 [Gemmatimonadales bacterium]
MNGDQPEAGAPADTKTPTVGDRLRAAGISEERIAQHLAQGAITLDGEPVFDLDDLAPAGTRPLFTGS